jgi:hypothetical protein
LTPSPDVYGNVEKDVEKLKEARAKGILQKYADIAPTIAAKL